MKINKTNNNIYQNLIYPSVYYTIYNGRYSHNNIGSWGAIGCYLSHVNLWKKLVNSDENMYLIFEDDVDINHNINLELINQDLKELNNIDWDFLFLGSYDIFGTKYNNNNKFNKIKNILYGLHSYIITKKGALKLLENALPLVDQLDSYISFMGLFKDVNIYRSTKNYFIQNNITNSSIQTDNSIKPFITQYDEKIYIYIILFIILMLIGLIYLLYKNLQCKEY